MEHFEQTVPILISSSRCFRSTAEDNSYEG